MHGPISAADLRETVVQAFDPVLSAAGYEHVVDLKWVRSGEPWIRHVIEAYGGRRGVRAVRWGISLDFVPHVTGASVRWHRTARSARIDLGYDPESFRDEWDFTAQAWTISPDLGVPTPGERARSIAAAFDRAAFPWLDAIRDLPTLADAFQREESRRGGIFEFDNYIQHRLAYAFTLAKLGRQERAEVQLERWLSMGRVGSEVEATLVKLLRCTEG